MNFLEYNKDEKLSFNYKKSCGLWLIVVALIIFCSYCNRWKADHQYVRI